MDIVNQPGEPATEGPGRFGELLHRISDDLKTIAKDELELAKGEIGSAAKKTAGETAAIVLGGIVALIGLAMLCVSVVVAIDFLIASLAWRLLLMAIIYLVVGGIVAGVFARKLGSDVRPDLKVPAYEATRTVKGAKQALSPS